MNRMALHSHSMLIFEGLQILFDTCCCREATLLEMDLELYKIWKVRERQGLFPIDLTFSPLCVDALEVPQNLQRYP